MAIRAYIKALICSQEVILGLQMQVSGEGKVSEDTLRSGMHVAAVQNKLMRNRGL